MMMMMSRTQAYAAKEEPYDADVARKEPNQAGEEDEVDSKLPMK